MAKKDRTGNRKSREQRKQFKVAPQSIDRGNAPKQHYSHQPLATRGSSQFIS